MAEKGDEISMADLVQQISSLPTTVSRLEAKFEASEGTRPKLYQDCEALNSAPTPPIDSGSQTVKVERSSNRTGRIDPQTFGQSLDTERSTHRSAIGQSLDPERSTHHSASPAETSSSAADILKDFERLRDSLVRIPVPNNFKVNDTTTGIKQDWCGTLRVLSKCARFAETGLKVLTTLPDERDSSSVSIQREDLESIFVVFAAQINFLQSEYAGPVVKSTFNDETSRMFRSFENNASSFSRQSLQSVRIAAELASIHGRTNTASQSWRGRRRGVANQTRGSYSSFPLNRRRPRLLWGGRPSPVRLGSRNELCQRLAEASRQCVKYNIAPGRRSYDYCSSVESEKLVPKTKKVIHCQSNQTTTRSDALYSKGPSTPGGAKKPQMGMVCLENLWAKALGTELWPPECIKKFPQFLAPSPLAQYNKSIEKFKLFCENSGCDFPPTSGHIEGYIASFLNQEAEKSEIPESVLKTLLSALKHYCHAVGIHCQMQKIDTFVKALIKADTKRPAGGTKVMPTNNFVKLFKNWGANENLSLRRLRQKAVTLLALTAMCRPSDLAPRVGFMRDQIHFNDDGSMTVLFYGIKNGTDRHGFEVRIGRSECALTDPVLCLKDYIRRTNQNITESQKQPEFIT
ncbi:hypothetical protein PoB_001676700 [Plakobranchus ocellatus]|uniref:Uncharacterized protein n=1 Tax=Plakobranchus ocellatus TaxID=259542 RepID=A0AAV3Z6T6_9GAST|nr:hypothetical protein PoB_001676700 [Plakobranchus ocellatus]